jgi:hypothetical protein
MLHAIIRRNIRNEIIAIIAKQSVPYTHYLTIISLLSYYYVLLSYYYSTVTNFDLLSLPSIRASLDTRYRSFSLQYQCFFDIVVLQYRRLNYDIVGNTISKLGTIYSTYENKI